MNSSSGFNGQPRPSRLLLVEDNPLFVEQIQDALALQARRWTVLQVSEGLRALNLIHQKDQALDLAMVDLGLPDISGIEVVKACSRQFPEVPIVVISVMASEPLVMSAIEAGARGYILKGETVDEITRAIDQVMQGIYPLSPSLARFLFKKLSGDQPSPRGESSARNAFNLTPRELETLSFLAQGLTYEGVAVQMGVALSTIQWNVRNLYRKLNVRSQVQAITKARSHDLI
jgi:two-component system nitrate/nitrite response regulator NarL